MNCPVIIKGNKEGIRIIIHPDAFMEQILNILKEKLQTTKRYYKSIHPISVTFEGKHLTEEEMIQITNALNDLGLNIKNNSNQTSKEKDIINLLSEKNNMSDGLFFIGSLKSGQTLKACTSIIIIGDIEPGASVISKGNIVVIGSANGYVKAGFPSKNDAFVYSLKGEM